MSLSLDSLKNVLLGSKQGSPSPLKEFEGPLRSCSWCMLTCVELWKRYLSVEVSIFFLLVDNYSRYCWVYFINTKLEAFGCFHAFKALMEKQAPTEIKTLRTDCSGEFISNDFKTFCSEIRIKRKLTVPYTLQHNGVVEWKNQKTVEMARTLLHAKVLPKNFWVEVVATTVHNINIVPTIDVTGRTPHEVWYGS